jgi:hypothetical protein
MAWDMECDWARDMAWGRLALIQAAGEDEAVRDKIAEAFGYQAEKSDDSQADNNELPPADEKHQEPIAQQEPNKPNKTPRPPALFLRVKKLQTLNNTDDGKPAYLNDTNKNFNKQTSTDGTYCFAPPSQLLPMSRLCPFLHNGLGQARTGGKIDHRRLIKQIATGKALRRLPYLPRHCWPQRLQILVDPSPRLEPYWADFAFIIEKLQKLLGEEAVTAIRFDEQSLSDEQAYCLPWPTQNQHRWQAWHKPPEDVAILILSDLGISNHHPAARVRWQYLLKCLQSHTAPILTLSPVAQSPADLALCRFAKPNPLNDVHNLPRYPKRNGFSLPTNDNIKDILALLSPLPLLDTGLLRRLRRELNWGGSELESQIWNHPDIQRDGLGAFLHESVLESYREHYHQLQDKSQAQTLQKIVKDHHKNAFQGLKNLNTFAHATLNDEDNAEALSYYQSLCATLAQAAPDSTHYDALIMQCRMALTYLPKTAKPSQLTSMTHQLYALAYRDELRAGLLPEPLPVGFDLNKHTWLLNPQEQQQRGQWQIVQTGGRGQFSCQKIEAMPSNLTVRPEPVEGGAAKSFMVRQAHHERLNLNLAIATLETLFTFPPLLSVIGNVKTDTTTASPLEDWQWSNPPVDGQTAVHNQQQFTLSDKQVIRIESHFQHLELEAIKKPDWATSLWRDSQGLCASLAWRGENHTIAWQTAKTSNWTAPFGEDDIGFYVDVPIKNLVQRFRWIKAGEFLMGSPPDEPERWNGETQHKVTLTQGYWLADTACTQALWQAVTGENPARFKEDLNNPVEQVSWNAVQIFIDKLNQLIPNLNACLPTEAQWEYACRAGTTTPFSFGDNITPEQVNYDGDNPYNNAEKGLYRGKTVAVKSLPPNAWGLYEMHGNVYEWCNDWFGDYPTKEATNPTGATDGTNRVLRGGSWGSLGWSTRSAYRNRFEPAFSSDSIGFRFALGQPAQPVQESERHRHGQASSGSAPPVSGGAASDQDNTQPKKNFFDRLKDRIKPK